MAEFLEQLGSELSFIRADNLSCDWNRTLHYCRIRVERNGGHYEPTHEDDLLHDILLKCLRRGRRPFTSYFAEQKIISAYGVSFSVEEKPRERKGAISYSYDDDLTVAYRNFTDVVDPWHGDAADIEFDPKHPKNERRLFTELVERFGAKLAHCIEPQVPLNTVLPKDTADAFIAQRGDLLLSFPNGRGLLLEPGDHDDTNQIALDNRRDDAFDEQGIKTLRPRNDEIQEPQLYENIQRAIDELGGMQYLDESEHRTETELAANYLFLLPSLITRIERLLLHIFLRHGLLHRDKLNIGIIERDLECAELSIATFMNQLTHLCKLYDIDCKPPEIYLFVQRNPIYRYGDLGELDYKAEVCDSFVGRELDMILDVGIKCNALTAPVTGGAPIIGAVRQAYSHNHPVRFGYCAQVRPVNWSENTEDVLNFFVRDFFRKHELRPGQGPILKNVLAQKATIGLLPTSAGKSLCYQLAALLTPGTTIVVDPLVALMKDQVQSLKDQYGIDRVLAWHAGAGLYDENIAAVLTEHLILFLSPERLLRPGFRNAMNAIRAADIYINYAVIDEAHCVSMWGHDFRPSYLSLERNFREYCLFQGRPPVLVALTGTASQLVLIDLKRELNISDLDAIIRPKTFDRPELNFNLVSCSGNDKRETLNQVLEGIARRLNVDRLDTDAHGIIFTYTPREAWSLFGSFVGDANECVGTVLAGNEDAIRCGVYTGSAPREHNEALFSHEEWGNYKERTLSAFKRGQIHMLCGNTAVSVGIDNEYLNYIVNYRMPQSLEAYYQQCGRAGRAGQKSECYLIFSDDAPETTQQWLNRDIQERAGWDDIGTVAYFHQSNFPGQQNDCEGALSLLKQLLGNPNQNGQVVVPQFFQADMTKNEAERTEHYLSYWLILGVLVDYEVTGIGGGTAYHVRRHNAVEQFLKDRNDDRLTTHIIDSLQRYLSRYRPTARTDIETRLNSRTETTMSGRSIGFLVDFLYDQIEYQRREAIRTMVSFCNQTDASPEKLRSTIRAYFDTSEKFSEGLQEMAERVPDFGAVAALLVKVDGFDDIEHLYWETRRLLDERFRSDWAAANLFAIAYREKGTTSDTFFTLLDNIITDLSENSELDTNSALQFLSSLISCFTQLDKVFNEDLSLELQGQCIAHLYEKYRMKYIETIDIMDVDEDTREFLHLFLANIQLKEITNAKYAQTTG